jgi:putative FmdB family regulatory protein
MPIYEYICKGCGHEFEREQRISEAPLKKCPSCGAQKARRLISRTSFVLKGGGWYNDLYAAPKAEKKADAPKEEAKPSTDASDTKAAPAAPAETGTKTEPPPKKGKGKKAAA